MPDREKIIKGITHHKLGQCDMSGKICPYWEEEADCMKKMLGDALALLKEQEAIVRCMDKCCENCTYFDNGQCSIDNEPKDLDMVCKYWSEN